MGRLATKSMRNRINDRATKKMTPLTQRKENQERASRNEEGGRDGKIKNNGACKRGDELCDVLAKVGCGRDVILS